RKRSSVPPGPQGYPVIGNIFDMPPVATLSQGLGAMSSKFGDIIYLTIFSQPLLALNSQKVAFELLGTKGDSSAGRPHAVMASELSGYDRFMAMMQSSDRLRDARKYLQRAVGPQHAKNYAAAQQEQVVRFLKKLAEEPDKFEEHSKWIVGAATLIIAYGYHTQDIDDPYIAALSTVLDQFAIAAAPGKWLVDFLPILKYLPSWFPGTQYKKLATYFRAHALTSSRMPYDAVKEQMRKGVMNRSLIASFLEETPNPTQDEEEFMMFLMADLYGGGLHSMTSLMTSFFLAMVMNQSAQMKAQAEIDAVCNLHSRLPTFTDKSSLPYVEALVLEVLRWGAPIPLGIPHRFTTDEVYQGYTIPKGTHAFANIGAIVFDSSLYPEPELFRPERFLGPNPQLDPRKTVFGFGRR
ncbi:cytochrome P450, partial [Mycena maculata]